MLLDAAPGSASVPGLWRHIQQSPGLDALMMGLLGAGFGRLPDFALLSISGEGRHLICRGLGTATMISSTGARRVDGAGLTTWSEQAVTADVMSVVLGDLPADNDMTLPALAGVFLAEGVIIDLIGASECGDVPRKPGAGLAVASDDAIPAVAPSPGAVSFVSVEPGGNAAAAAPVASDDEIDRHGSAQDREYDDVLFGSTRARSIEDAAIQQADEADVGPPLASAAPHVPGPADLVPDAQSAVTFEKSSAPARAESASVLPLARPTGLIVSVPWDLGDGDGVPATTRTASVAPPPAPVAATSEWAASAVASDEDEGLTVRRGARVEPPARPVLADHIGPVVLAGLCPGQHPNPPNAAVCRICRQPVPEQEPVPVSRPVLGVLRLSTGDVVSLDRGVIMGRNPPTAEFDGDERLHSVKLPGGEGEISRAHLRVTIDGWHVLVTDLRSTNGTLITLPGRDPEQVRPSYPTQIQPGTVVTLADGIGFRYEVT